MNTDHALHLLWKHRWGLIGVVFIHLAFVIYSRNKVVIPYQSILQAQENAEVEVNVATPEEEKQLVPLDQLGQVSNMDYNVADKRTDVEGRYDSRFDQKTVDQNVYDELKALEKAEFEKLGTNMNPEDPNTSKQRENSGEVKKNNTNVSTEKGSGAAPKGTTTAEYDLAGRRNEGAIPKPSYTCIGSGKLVVKIKVNRSGKVTGARVDDAASSYTEECMKLGAEKYAMRAKFEASATAPEPQEGTITYRYISQ